jgi:tripartite-type tricarboxylate transporter receptor subunit TctC
MRRRALALLLLLYCVVCRGAYPERPIRLIVPAAPGGAIDVVGRMIGGKLAEVLGQNIVIDNRAGANNIIGSEIAARSVADGYTLLTTAGAHTINPAVYRKLPYDPLRDFTPVSRMCDSGGLVIVVHPSFPARSLAELIELAKANPAKINYGSGGFGNLTHVAGEMFKVMAGIRITHVPYKAVGPAVNDLLAGHIPLMFGPSPVVIPMVQSGRLRALAYTGTARSPQLPNVPTVEETGFKGYVASGWYGLYGPRGLPAPIVSTLASAVRRVVQMPEMRERFAGLNLEPVGSTPAEFAAFLREDLQRYARIAKAANIEPQ